MLVLFETPAGYALFKGSKEKRFEKVYNVISTFSERDSLASTVQLDTFTEFKDTKEALVSTDRLIDDLLPKTFDKFLNTNPISQDAQSTLMTYGKDVTSAVAAELDIVSVQDKKMEVLSRGVEFQLNSLIEGLKDTENKDATLSLANGLSRYKLMFSTEKVDIMIIQAVSLLEDLDREIVKYTMRLKEWYGWHFPELDKIVTDNVLYARAVKAIGIRTNCHGSRFCEFLSEDIEAEVREAIELSMGNEITLKDEEFIRNLAGQVIELDEYRVSLTEYLKTRMLAIAPNLTQIVGELVGAKLIAQAGSLISLAKYPSSTIQILGAEKALLKAIKTNQNTPKYGLIYQASLIEQSSDKIKGKLSRTLAAKCSVCLRVDALGESENGSVGQECKEYLEGRLKYLESTLHQHERGHNHKKHNRPHAHQQHQQQHWIKEKEYNRKSNFSKEFVPNQSGQFVPGLNKKRNINEHAGFEYNDRNRFGRKKRKHFEGCNKMRFE